MLISYSSTVTGQIPFLLFFCGGGGGGMGGGGDNLAERNLGESRGKTPENF